MKVSIAMTTYNGARHLDEQLRSLAVQTLLPCELQIGDDGSDDATEEMVERFARQAPFPVRFIRNDDQLGYGENFLRTASRCSGNWIAFCDQDDIWHPEKLERCAKAIQDGPSDLKLVAHHAWMADEHGQSTGRLVYSLPVGTFPSLALPGAWFCAGFMQVFRAELVRDLPLRPRAESPRPPEPDKPHLVRDSHDTWIPILANVLGSITVLPDALACYRRHGSAVSDLPRFSAMDKARTAISAHGAEYGRMGQWYEDSAAILTEHARIIGSPEVAAKLRAGAHAFHQESLALRLRSLLHLQRGPARKLELLAGLLKNGAYRRRWTMSPRSLLKDVSHALLPG